MIYVCELYRQGGAHVPVNAGMLQIIRLASPDEEVCFFADAEHVEHVREQVGPEISSSIAWKTIDTPSPRAIYVVNLLSALKIYWQLAKSLSKSSRKRLVVTSADDSTIVVALKFLERFAFKGVRIQVIVHGGMTEQRFRNPWLRFKDTTTALSVFPNSSIQYLVLEHDIGRRILQVLPSLAGKIEVLEHPLPPNERNSYARELSTPIRFGFLGLATSMKGFPVFLDLAAQISRKYPGKAEFHVIGRLASDQKPRPEMELLATKPRSDRMSREQFIEEVKRLHFVIMPYKREYYEFSPSGTLVDAITWQVPVIATRLPIFERTFESSGSIGYLFDSEIELYTIVEDIVNAIDHSRYKVQISNLREAHGARTPEKLASVYRQICIDRA